jgi:peptide/nickel transport system permease protein
MVARAHRATLGAKKRLIVPLGLLSVIVSLFIASVLNMWLPLPDAHVTELSIRSQGPSFEHPLGTDQLGRSILARVVEGAKYSIGISFIIVLSSMAIGIPLGMYCGLYIGAVDRFLMVLSDMMLTLPSFILALIIGALTDGGVWALLIPLISFYSASLFRVARATATRIREHGYIVAAFWMGQPFWHMFRTHLWPNGRRELLAVSCSDFGAVLLVISGLSYVGVGLDPSTAEWGAMLRDAQRVILSHPWEMAVPATVIMLICFCAFQISKELSR